MRNDRALSNLWLPLGVSLESVRDGEATMDRITSQARSTLMRRIKSNGTAPELALRGALWAAGLRYRLRSKLPGKPDITFPAARVAVFVDGCFWHRCPIHGHVPKGNIGYWAKKLARNRERDLAANRALGECGWLPMRVWEHEVTEDLASCVARISKAVQLRSQ